MGFLSFGKKKNDISAPTLDSSVPKDQLPPIDSIPIPDGSNIAPDSSSVPPAEVPSIPSAPDSTANPADSTVDSPAPEAKPVDTSKDVPSVTEEKAPIESLPDFSEDDFSAPIPPKKLSTVSENKDVPDKKEVSTSQSFSPPEKEMSEEGALLDSPTSWDSDPDTASDSKPVSHSFTPSPAPTGSFSSSDGVFVSRTSYLKVLSSLKESSKELKSLSSKRRKIIEFNTLMKKSLDTHFTDSENFHKEILAVVPYISKK